jgi:hypothetical protein
MDGRGDPDPGARAAAQGVRSRRSALKLALLGSAVGVTGAFAILRFVPKPAPPSPDESKRLAGAVLVEDARALEMVLFQYTHTLEDVVLPTYTDFLRALDPSTRLVAVVPKGDAPALTKMIGKIDLALIARTHVVETDGPITVWSKDRALVLEPARAGDRAQLVVPVRPDPRWKERFNDWATLASVARDLPQSFVVTEMPIEFDAGDFAVTGDKVIVDVNLFVKNEKRGFSDGKALVDLLAKTFSRKIVYLGEKDGDVPRHHLSMYMTPLGDGVVLVGDPRAGRSFVGEGWKPGEESPDTAEPLVADFSEDSLARFDRAAKELAAAGFKVERIPVVPFDDKTYVTYTNGVYETRGGKKIAYVPQYDVKNMDETALETYRRLGWETRAIHVRAAYRFHGTIGCLCNVLRRGAP